MNAYAAISHRYWARPGGGQLVSAAAAFAMHKLGYMPVLTSPAEFDPEKYLDWFGIDLRGFPKVTLGFRLRAFGIYMRLLIWMPVAKAIRMYKPSYVLIDEFTYKPILKLKSRYGFKLIEYIHFPFEVYFKKELSDFAEKYGHGQDPYVQERYGRFPMNIYWGLYLKLLPRYARENPFAASDAVFANSTWTAKVAEQIYGEAPVVLNPPIPPNTTIVDSPRPFEDRDPVVVMVGRFTEEKRYHWVIQSVMPRLIEEVPDVKLVIFGGAGTRTAYMYMDRLRSLIGELGLNGRVELMPDAPRKAINEAMDRARAFLHATINEHWGVAVAEAMARGLPPVVHKSGGAWTDLAEEGRFGLGYESAEEAAEALAKLLTDGKAWRSYAEAIPSRVAELTLDKFAERLGAYIGR
ncbi:MAG: glycosyltransferase [Thermoproteus sp.]|nr:glycosyltransferase [Thermoproteus sp.]